MKACLCPWLLLPQKSFHQWLLGEIKSSCVQCTLFCSWTCEMTSGQRESFLLAKINDPYCSCSPVKNSPLFHISGIFAKNREQMLAYNVSSRLHHLQKRLKLDIDAVGWENWWGFQNRELWVCLTLSVCLPDARNFVCSSEIIKFQRSPCSVFHMGH